MGTELKLPSGRGAYREQSLIDFAQALEELGERAGFKISARGWCYQMDEIDYTRTEEEHERVAKEAEFEEVLGSNDYSILARVYRRLNKEIYEGRKRGWYTFMENTSYPSEGELRQQRRDISDRMLEIENVSTEVDGK